MRDRVLELLPLLLVGAVLFIFFLLRAQGPALSFVRLTGQAPRSAAVVMPSPTPLIVEVPTFTTVQGAPCNPHRPVFIGGMALLRTALGSRMGDPVECEHGVDTAGDTQQQTTAGLAYYRKEPNASCFTTGWEHWALLLDRDLVYWAGESVNPPRDATIVTSH